MLRGTTLLVWKIWV